MTSFCDRLSLLASHFSNNENPSSMIQSSATCGIIAHVCSEKRTSTPETSQLLMNGLKILMNRGYDSAGVSMLRKNPKSGEYEIDTTKYASESSSTSNAIKKLEKALKKQEVGGTRIGIGHTRWATHGAKTDTNAHPHVDQWERFSLIHNGVIHNADQFRDELKTRGVHFQSETDTEVIVQLIGAYAALDKMDTLDAVRKTHNQLEGTWGIVLLDTHHPDRLIAFCNGSPLLIGIGAGEMFIASESSAFSQFTKSYIPLEDGEIVVITSDGHSLSQSRVELAQEETVKTSPDPYPHWTIKEIEEQPAAISRALNYGGRIANDHTVKLGGLEENLDRLLPIRHLVIGACGTSYHAGLYGARLMRYLHAFDSVRVVDAAEMTRDDFPVHRSTSTASSSALSPTHATGFLVLSQSGETKDVHRALQLAESLDILSFSIVNKVRSLIARFTSCGVYLNAGREHAVASTKAFTCSVIVLALVATWFSQQSPNTDAQRRKSLINALHRHSSLTGSVLRSVEEQCKHVAEKVLIDAHHCFILGKGFAEPIAYEGALKIKEITYLHAEGYAGGSLKHGPFALLDDNVPVILIILNDEHLTFMETAAQEIKARKAKLIIITDLPRSHFAKLKVKDIITIPNNGVLTALLTVIPLQLIAYYLSIKRGIDCDYPRHLAKTVTTD